MTTQARKAGREVPELTLDDTLDFMRSLWELDHALAQASRSMETRLGVTGPQRLVLRLVSKHPSISPGDVARILHLHPSTMTGIVARLERKALLARSADELDGRRSRLMLTNEGKQLARTTGGTIESSVRELLARWPAAKLRSTREVLADLSRALGKI